MPQIDATSYNPLAAPAETPRVFTNIYKLVKNEVGDMPAELKTASNIPATDEVPYWELTFETVDATFPDGNPLTKNIGTKLFNKDGKALDDKQRPAVIAQAFAAHGIVIWPLAPDYDAGAVIGNHFLTQDRDFATGRPVPLPIEVLGKDYVHPADKVRIITPRDTTLGTASAQTVVGIELTENPDRFAALKEVLDGINMDDTSTVMAVLEQGGFNGCTIGGVGIFSLVVRGELAAKVA